MPKQSPIPLGYLLTFSCYGTHLHGDPRGSVTTCINEWGAPTMPANPELVEQMRGRMKHRPYEMDRNRRRVVLPSIVQTCLSERWFLYAAHVRSNHVHIVVQAALPPEWVMKTFKARASYHLNHSRVDYRRRKRWTRHGSTRYLWTPDDLRNAIRYVLEEQGEPMEIYRAEF